MELNALIVDDEYPAREEIRYHLKKYSKIHVVGEAATISEALALISALKYDLVFLDINFPIRDGIDLGMEIQNMDNCPYIIYVTAYEKYAVKAFDVDAVDYILKPIDEKKFDRAIKRVVKAYNNETDRANNSDNKIAEENIQNTKQNLNSNSITRISAEVNGKIHLIDLDEVYYAFVDKNYVFIKKYDDKIITRYTLTSLENKLQNMNFFRANRSYLVNLNKIKEISPFFKGTCNIVLSDKENSNISVSRRQSKKLKIIFDF